MRVVSSLGVALKVEKKTVENEDSRRRQTTLAKSDSSRKKPN